MKVIKYILFIHLFSFIITHNSFAQVDKNSKEEINITSSFKPSIIKGGKIEFRPDAIPRDTSKYKFQYDPIKLSFTTPMSGFTIKPLAYFPVLKEADSNQLVAQIGYGNLKSPFGTVSYVSRKKNQYFSVNADYLSMKGKLLNQQHAIGDLGITYKKRLTENYQFTIGTGIQDYNYRRYGFDTSRLLLEDELKQHFTNFSLFSTLQNVAGEEGNIVLNPSVKFDYLTTNLKFNSYLTRVDLPIDFKWKKNILFNIDPSLDWIVHSSTGKASGNSILSILPLSTRLKSEKWILNLMLVTALFEKQTRILPNIHINHSISKDELFLKGGFKSSYELVTPFKLFNQNPFTYITALAKVPVYEQQKIYAGIDWFSNQGVKFDFEAGYVQHKNLPLFINDELLGKDFYPYFESLIYSLDVTSSVKYTFNQKLSFSGLLKWMYFQEQKDFKKPFGVIPFEMQLTANWSPIQKLHVRMNTNFWTGSYAKKHMSDSIIQLKAVPEINMGITYKFNEKWGFWADLNNIANVQYQRWNQYTAYGFNFKLGARYVLGKTSKQ